MGSVPRHLIFMPLSESKSTRAGLLLAIEHKTVDVDTAFAEFNAIVNYFVEKYIPSRTVCIKPKDPVVVAFLTV